MRSFGTSASQDTVLDGLNVTTIFGLLPGGLTLDELSHIARARLKPREVIPRRPRTLAEFRLYLRRSNDPERRVIVNFHRGPLFGEGGGHHSPIGGYLAEEDLVLVLDVNREFRPWLVEPERLYEAVNTIDPSSKRARGLLVVQPPTPLQPLH